MISVLIAEKISHQLTPESQEKSIECLRAGSLRPSIWKMDKNWRQIEDEITLMSRERDFHCWEYETSSRASFPSFRKKISPEWSSWLFREIYFWLEFGGIYEVMKLLPLLWLILLKKTFTAPHFASSTSLAAHGEAVKLDIGQKTLISHSSGNTKIFMCSVMLILQCCVACWGIPKLSVESYIFKNVNGVILTA